MSLIGRVALLAGVAFATGIAPRIAIAADVAQSTPGASAQAQAHWARDEQSGCQAPDPDFAEGDGIVWSGTCTNGVVSGAGTLTFLNKGGPQVTISGTFSNGSLVTGHASLAWPDGSKYDGEQVGGQFNGHGVFVSADGDKLEGTWKDGKLNGHGTVTWANGNHYEGDWQGGKAEGKGVEVWANGDRYDGEWHDGKASGHGEQHWANGQRYSGEWSNDQPNGIGELTRSDGSKYQGSFVDGHPKSGAAVVAAEKPQKQTTQQSNSLAVPAAIATPSSTAEAGAPNAHLDDLEGKKLLAVDGSSIALAAAEGGFTREITMADGGSSTVAFTFVNDRMGTVADAANAAAVIGLFRMTDDAIDIDYSDGHSEVLKPYPSGGVTLAMRAPGGNASCMAWYPAGHTFSAAERKAALAEYASRLGVPLPGAGSKGPTLSSACGVSAAAVPAAPAARVVGSKLSVMRERNVPRPLPKPIRASYVVPGPTEFSANSPTNTPSPDGPQGVFVRTSEIHLIDQPKPPAPPAAGGQDVKLADLARPVAQTQAPGAVAAAPVATAAIATAGPGQEDASDSGASTCLSVGSDGTHWGFKNQCSYAVQFVYCLKGSDDPLADCKAGAVAGSAAPNGFSALVADGGMKDRNADHQFRWVACSGGAGEVVPHLDGIEPPSGRCVRRRTAQN